MDKSLELNPELPTGWFSALPTEFSTFRSREFLLLLMVNGKRFGREVFTMPKVFLDPCNNHSEVVKYSYIYLYYYHKDDEKKDVRLRATET